METLFDYIILIDDNEASNYYHKIIINDSALVKRADFFSNPEKALQFFSRNQPLSPSPAPDLVFLDINMPLLNGWEFVEELMQLQLPKYPPIIMLSTTKNPYDQEKLEQYTLIKGMYTKPLDEEILKEIHRDIIIPSSASS